MKQMTIDESINITLNGFKFLLEAGDIISVIDKEMINEELDSYQLDSINELEKLKKQKERLKLYYLVKISKDKKYAKERQRIKALSLDKIKNTLNNIDKKIKFIRASEKETKVRATGKEIASRDRSVDQKRIDDERKQINADMDITQNELETARGRLETANTSVSDFEALYANRKEDEELSKEELDEWQEIMGEKEEANKSVSALEKKLVDLESMELTIEDEEEIAAEDDDDIKKAEPSTLPSEYTGTGMHEVAVDDMTNVSGVEDWDPVEKIDLKVGDEFAKALGQQFLGTDESYTELITDL